MKLIEKKLKNLIENNVLALATISDDKPHVIAVSFCKMLNGKIIITNNFMRKTIENLIKNNNIALVVWDKKNDGYQISGKAKYFNSGKWLNFVKKMKENKNMPTKGAIVIKILQVIKSQ